jgi:uncharacterized membrane protein
MTAPIADTRTAGGPTAADLAQAYGRHGGYGDGQGWVVFAGTMVALAGSMNLIHGIAAVSNSKIFSRHTELVISSLHTWGWVVLVFGALQILAAFGIWVGNVWARWFGVAVAGLNALIQLSWANEFPIWSLTIFALDVIVIYGLVVHGGRQVEPVE